MYTCICSSCFLSMVLYALLCSLCFISINYNNNQEVKERNVVYAPAKLLPHLICTALQGEDTSVFITKTKQIKQKEAIYSKLRTLNTGCEALLYPVKKSMFSSAAPCYFYSFPSNMYHLKRTTMKLH